MAVADSAGWNAAEAGVVIVEVLLRVCLRWCGGPQTVGALHRRNIIGGVGRLDIGERRAR